jgi:hypothetical protein
MAHGKEAPEPTQHIAGFDIPRPGPRFKDALRWQADLAIGRILAILKAELGAAEAAEIFEVRLKASFKVKRKRGRPPSLSEGQKRRLSDLSDEIPRRRIADDFAGEPGFPKTPAALEKRVQAYLAFLAQRALGLHRAPIAAEGSRRPDVPPLRINHISCSNIAEPCSRAVRLIPEGLIPEELSQ